MAMTAEPSIGQLRWRTRRGMRELDMMLQRYLDEVYPRAAAGDQAAFADLLEQSDADILDWMLGRRIPPDHLARIIHELHGPSLDA